MQYIDQPWVAAIAVGVVTYGWTMYCIYYNIIVVVGSANSQDYAGRFDVVPGRRPNSVRLRPAASATGRELPRWLSTLGTYATYLVRRDFISWFALLLAALHQTRILFIGFTVGGIGTALIVTVDHVKLLRVRRSIVRRGQVLEAAS